MAGNIPFSKANVVTLIDCETEMGVANAASTTAKKIAYDSNTLARQQALTANTELRGIRRQGTYVVGPKNPGGAVNGHMTDQTVVMFYEALLGSRSSGSATGYESYYVGVAQSATTGATPPEAGVHAYKIVFTSSGNHSLPTAYATITADGTHKVTVTRYPTANLATGVTWDIYRTEAGADRSVAANFKKVTASPLTASTSTYEDDIADASLTTAAPTSATLTTSSYAHVITIGETLPTYTIERSIPYVNDADAYTLALGCGMDRGRVNMKSTGYFDFAGDFLAMSVSTQAASFASSSSDWRNGNKIHHAMIGSGNVSLGGAGASLSEFLKFLDFNLDHANNLDKTDYPLGLAGDRGSCVPGIAQTTITGTLKVSDPDALALLQTSDALWTIRIKHDFATAGHFVLHEFMACQFEPADAPITGQGIGTATFTAHVVEDPNSNEQIRVTVVNGEAGTVYDAP